LFYICHSLPVEDRHTPVDVGISLRRIPQNALCFQHALVAEGEPGGEEALHLALGKARRRSRAVHVALLPDVKNINTVERLRGNRQPAHAVLV
jgi:hypothetical protein